MPQTLEQAQRLHDDAVDANRALGIVKYKSRQKQSEAVYEVVEGRKHLADGRVLGPGQRFHPTESEIRETRPGRNSLAGKAREISRTEYSALERGGRSVQSAGADIGLRSLTMTNHALSLALDAKLAVEDFAGIEPGSEQGYTKAQVEEIIAKKAN